MTTNIQTERTRRSIGTKATYCPFCNKPLSYRDSEPFCRTCNLFNHAFKGVKHDSIRSVKRNR